MMPELFALWKFKVIEGVRPSDFLTTKFVKGIDETYEIHYDPRISVCTIINTSDKNVTPTVCKFSELVDVLKGMGVYKERLDNRHSSSFIPFTGKVEQYD